MEEAKPAEPRRARRPIDDDHIFLLQCMEESGFKPNFQLLGERSNKTKDAIRMRFNRLKSRIRAAQASESPSMTDQATEQAPERAEEKRGDCNSHDTEPITQETESPDV